MHNIESYHLSLSSHDDPDHQLLTTAAKNIASETNPVDVLPYLIDNSVRDSFHHSRNGVESSKVSDKKSFHRTESQSTMSSSSGSSWSSSRSSGSSLTSYSLSSNEAESTNMQDQHPINDSMCTSPRSSWSSWSSSSSSFLSSVPLSDAIDDKGRHLGEDFTPGNWDVICGRGKASYDHIGNRRFRLVVANNLERYVKATTQLEKSIITKEIICQIRENASAHDGSGHSNDNVNCCDDDNFCGGFVAKDRKGKWYEVGTVRAREKVGHTFRDYMKGALLRRNNNKCTADELQHHINEAQDTIFQACRLMKQQQKRKKIASSMGNGGTKSNKKIALLRRDQEKGIQ